VASNYIDTRQMLLSLGVVSQYRYKASVVRTWVTRAAVIRGHIEWPKTENGSMIRLAKLIRVGMPLCFRVQALIHYRLQIFEYWASLVSTQIL